MASLRTVVEPVKPRTLPLSVPSLQGNEWAYLKECLDTGWVSSVGPFVDRFEREIATYVGTSHAVAVVNGTAALHTALRVIGVEPGDEVLVSALTFIAPVNAIRYCGAHPIFVDAGPSTWQMDVDKLEQFLRKACELRRPPHGESELECRNRRTGRRVRAILPVHILGLACDMKRIMELAQQHHLQVVEDAAEGMGVRDHGQHVGGWGDVGTLSFNGNKIMTAGGGGMVVTNHAGYAQYARYLSTQAKDEGPEYVHREIGYNYRLTNLQTAVGLAQLEQLDGFIKRKREIAAFYDVALGDLEELTLMRAPSHTTQPTYWLYTILLKAGTAVEERQAFITRLQSVGIEARPLWRPIHSLPPYQGCDHAGEIRVADDLYARAVSLPSSVNLSDEDLQRCAMAVRTFLESTA